MPRLPAQAGRKLLTVFLFLFTLTLVQGCSRPSKDNTGNKPAPPKHTVRVEPRPEDSGEIVRIHKVDEAGRILETEITYRNGERAREIYRINGSLAERQEFYKGGQVRQRSTIDEDGRTVLQMHYRQDGTLKLWQQALPDGSRQDTLYWSDGKQKFSETIKELDGTQKIRYFDKFGALTARKLLSANGEQLLQEQFDKNGKLIFKAEPCNTGEATEILTIYRPDGTIEMRQLFLAATSPWWKVSSLKTTELYDASGKKILMKVHMSISSYSYGYAATSTVDFVETFSEDGSRVVKHYSRYENDCLTQKEVFDSQGNLQSTESYNDPKPADPVEKRYRTDFERNDPMQAWQQEEPQN